MQQVQKKENQRPETVLDRYFDDACKPEELLDTLDNFVELMLTIQLIANDKDSKLRFYLDKYSVTIEHLIDFKSVIFAMVNYEKAFFE